MSRSLKCCKFDCHSQIVNWNHAEIIRYVRGEPNSVVEHEGPNRVVVRYFEGQFEVMFEGRPVPIPGHHNDCERMGVFVDKITKRGAAPQVKEVREARKGSTLSILFFCLVAALFVQWVTHSYIVPQWVEIAHFYLFQWGLESMGRYLCRDRNPVYCSDIMVNMFFTLLISSPIRWALAYLGVSHAFQLIVLALISPVLDLL